MTDIRRRGRVVGGGVVAGLLVFLGSLTVADASISYNGSDYTEVAGPRYATTCDKEADSHKVRGALDSNNTGRTEYNVTDGDGANAVCADVFWDRTVKRHRTCERNAFGIWTCGNFKTHP